MAPTLRGLISMNVIIPVTVLACFIFFVLCHYLFEIIKKKAQSDRNILLEVERVIRVRNWYRRQDEKRRRKRLNTSQETLPLYMEDGRAAWIQVPPPVYFSEKSEREVC